ncbi:S41 family peptidase [uncultured Thiohalocapsa sp.]|uniref:S41 family peptidase n=1 Tax=uncultured Thiohalocapsa sp. TaxID=768990 RepID=UPI0025EB2ACF|nr:S41 family peptidase [uncultured Thiohalocapsa sp.]
MYQITQPAPAVAVSALLAALALVALPVAAHEPLPVLAQQAAESPTPGGGAPVELHPVEPYQPPAPVAPPVDLPPAAAEPDNGSGAPAVDGPAITEESGPGKDQAGPAEDQAGPAKDQAGPAEEKTSPADDGAPATKPAATAAEAEDGGKTLPLDDLRTFAEVFGRIKSDYVEDVDDRELLASAIRGMLGGLDPHSSYLDPDAYRDLRVGTTGEFGGLGIEVGMEDGFVKVIAPIDDTPAERAGMQAGDLIVRIDGKPVKGLSLSDAVALMRGKPGSKIELTVVREGEGNPIQVTIVRDIIKVASVKSRTLEPGYGYLRVSNFQARTTEDLLEAIAELEAENSDGLKGVVLDLRNNPGGVLNAAVGVSDAFLDEGLIVYTMGRDEDAKLEFKAGPNDVLDGAPVAVLVNGGSASASEIVAGALQDQGRAIIMGEKTFGKGSVQTIVPIDDRTALKLTTARYYTPSGRSIQALGIEPDIELVRGKVAVEEEPDVAPLKEADLMRHLEDPENGAATAEDDDDEDLPLVAEDYQLAEALNVLKGLNLFRGAAAKQD